MRNPPEWFEDRDAARRKQIVNVLHPAIAVILAEPDKAGPTELYALQTLAYAGGDELEAKLEAYLIGHRGSYVQLTRELQEVLFLLDTASLEDLMNAAHRHEATHESEMRGRALGVTHHVNPQRNPLDERWSLNTIRWLETGPYSHVPAVRRLADELREGPQSAAGYRAIKKKIESVFNGLEARGQLSPEDEAAAINRALLEGSLGVAESGLARPMPGTRQGPLRDIEEQHPQAGRRQREREAAAARRDTVDELPEEERWRNRAIAALGPGHMPLFSPAPAVQRGLNVSCDNRDCTATGFAGETGLGGNIFEPNQPCPIRAVEEDPLVKEWNLGYDLDGGGYTFERVRGTELGNAIEILLHEGTMLLDDARRTVDKMLLWESPDLDYILGGDVMPGSDRHHGRASADLLLIAPGRGGLSWPDKIPEPDAYGNLGILMFEKRAEGELYETDHECAWCGAGTGTEPSPDPNCRRCDGDGFVNSPSGAWAIYERVEIEEEAEEEEDEINYDDYDDHSAGDENATASWQIGERGGQYFVKAWTDTEHDSSTLLSDDGPYATEEEASAAGRAAAVEWCANNDVNYEDEEEGDPDELLSIDLDSDEIDILQGWYSGQGDPLYALQSSGTLKRGDISSATSNLSDILRRAELGNAELEEDDVATIEGLIRKLEAAERLNR